MTLISCSFSDRKHLVAQKVTGNNDSIVLTENYIRLCYGLKTDVDTNNVMEHAMQLLNASDYKGCLELFKRKYNKLDTVRWHSGYYGLIIPDSNIQSYHTAALKYNPLDYLSFRYNNFIGDLANDEEAIIFQNSGNFDNPDELFKLQYVDGDIISYDKLRISDSVVAKRTIKDAEVLQKKYPESKRLEYILGSSYLVLGQDAKAIPIFNELINQNYYALLCLKKIINYLGYKNRLVEQEKYVTIFKKMYPDECLLIDQYNQLPIDSVKSICKECVEKGSQRDSISANIFLAKYFFNQRAFHPFDSIINIYFREHDYADSYDDLKVQEEHVYPDLKMRELFLLKEYNKMFHYENFIHLEAADVLKDFKNYTKQLYSDYISTDTSGFDNFYRKFFIPPPRQEWGHEYQKLQ